MKQGFIMVRDLLIHPIKTVQKKAFGQQKLSLWFISALPMVILLIATGLIDPAPGQKADLMGVITYISGALLICGFSMALGLARSFLVLWAGGKRLSLLGAAKELLPLNSLYFLLEAVYTLLLFVLQNQLPLRAYGVIEQICIFGLQLFYAIYIGVVLYYRENTKLWRTVVVGLGCFWASSGWLLIGMLTG